VHRLVALGARRVQRLEADGINGVSIVMQDPMPTNSSLTEWGAGQLTALNRSVPAGGGLATWQIDDQESRDRLRSDLVWSTK
jgi:hypothetical protein